MVSPATPAWKLVGPWYRWTDPGVKKFGRQSTPIVQKYAGPGFVDEFLVEPQRSLKPKDAVDYVHEVQQNGASFFSLSSLTLVKATPERTKVYLDIHDRFYLVVCELHCDVVGFPPVTRDQVAGAGLVVRRRKARIPAEELERVETLLGEIRKLETLISQLERATEARSTDSKLQTLVVEALGERQASRRGRWLFNLRDRVADLQRLSKAKNIRLALEGWVAGEHEGIGSWQEVEEEPETLAEAAFPLYPLVPDPGDEGHSGAGRTLYFGVLPVSSADTDLKGNARFEDRSLYEVRCFVERPHPGCPNDLVWSRPTATYQLASHSDLAGTSNKPTTIQMPDLKALEAQGAALPFGEGMGVHMVSPPDSALQFGADHENAMDSSGGTGGFQICSFSIPLITIVASFVLKLFLPVVVFIFGLWFLLRLKLCILPSVSIDADLSASLDIELDKLVELDADFTVAVDGALGFNLGGDVAGGLADEDDGVSLGQRAQLLVDMATDFSSEVDPLLRGELGYSEEITSHPDFPVDRAERPGTLPELTRDLEYYERIDPAEVPAP